MPEQPEPVEIVPTFHVLVGGQQQKSTNVISLTVARREYDMGRLCTKSPTFPQL